MNNNDALSLELYSLTKLYLTLDELSNKEQELVAFRKNNEKIDTSEYDSKKLSKLAGAVATYNRAFYSILFAPLENGSIGLEFGRFEKTFNFDYKKFVEQYLASNKDRVINEFYTFSQGKYLKLSKDDIANLVNDFVKCILWLISDKDRLKKYPNYISNNDNKKSVLEKILSQTMVEYFKVALNAKNELPQMQFYHMGKEYYLPIKYAVEYSAKCNPINLFLLFMSYKPWDTTVKTTQFEIPKINYGKVLQELQQAKSSEKRNIIKAPNNKPFETTNELERQLNILHSTSEGYKIRTMDKLKALDGNIEKINKEKIVLNESLKEMLNVIEEIPIYYASNPDAIKKMCFLYVNKRASNIQDLINLYETETWRNKLISSITDFRKMIALSSVNLSRQLSNMHSEMVDNNNALYDLTNKINNLKVDVQVDVDVQVENDEK